MRIEVTQKHINEGKRYFCEYCPVALAIREVVLSEVSPSVRHSKVRFIDVKELEFHPAKVPLPEFAIEWIEVFDHTPERAKPFSFDLDIPAELLRQPTRAD